MSQNITFMLPAFVIHQSFTLKRGTQLLNSLLQYFLVYPHNFNIYGGFRNQKWTGCRQTETECHMVTSINTGYLLDLKPYCINELFMLVICWLKLINLCWANGLMFGWSGRQYRKAIIHLLMACCPFCNLSRREIKSNLPN